VRRKYVNPTQPNRRLQIVRTVRGVSQSALAHASGIEPTRLLRIEHAVLEPTTDERHSIADALDVHASVVWPTDDIERRAIGAFVATELAA
jgi:transcriptional regulator with XRE-family HTH domain